MIAGIDVVVVPALPTTGAAAPTVVVAIKRMRILSVRLRRVLSRWCQEAGTVTSVVLLLTWYRGES